VHPLPDRLARAGVALLGRADDVVGARLQRLAHGGELRGGSIGKRLRREPLARGGLLHFQAVLVHAGDEQSLAPVQPHETLDRIGGDALVGMPDVRRAVGVGNRGGDVETLAHARSRRAFRMA
jgi:hypothetical protein